MALPNSFDYLYAVNVFPGSCQHQVTVVWELTIIYNSFSWNQMKMDITFISTFQLQLEIDISFSLFFLISPLCFPPISFLNFARYFRHSKGKIHWLHNFPKGEYLSTKEKGSTNPNNQTWCLYKSTFLVRCGIWYWQAVIQCNLCHCSSILLTEPQ